MPDSTILSCDINMLESNSVPTFTRKQQAILESVCHILAKPAQRQFSLTDIALEMDTSRAAPYRHFESKTQVCLALLVWCRCAIDAMFISIERETDLEMHEKALNKVQALLLFAQKNPGLVRIFTAEALAEEKIAMQELGLVWQHLRNCLSASFRLIQDYEKTQLASSPDAIADMVLDFVRGAYLRFSLSEFEDDLMIGFLAFADLLVHSMRTK